MKTSSTLGVIACTVAFALVVACGVSPAGPSDANESVTAPSASFRSDVQSTTTARVEPLLCPATTLILTQADKGRGWVVVQSNYAPSKLCPSLEWTLSPQSTFVPGIDKEGKEQVTVYRDSKGLSRAAAYTLRATGPNNLSATITIQ